MKKYKVTGMSCAACALRVEKAVSSVSGVGECSVNLLTGSMTVSGGDADLIVAAVEAVGYGAVPLDEKSTEKINTGADISELNARKRMAARLSVSVLLLLALMYLSMGALMLGLPIPTALSENPVAIALLQLLLSSLVLAVNQKFFISGVKAAIHLSPNMDTLVALGSGASYIWSVAVVFMMIFEPENAHQLLHELYFESAAMILTLITVGKMLEAHAKGRTANAINSLLSLTPKTANVIREGVEVQIPTDELRIGDIFIIRAGESIPTDGVIIEGGGSVNESALTGESIPTEKTVGVHVYAGTVSLTGYLKCEAVSVGDGTVMAGIVKMVEDAAASKAPIAKAADRVAGIFVPTVLAIAAVTLLIWSLVNGDLGHALARGIAVLVISCPCALGLATPVAIMVGSGIGARGGVLFKNAAALENTGHAKTVILDKTGTLTNGEPTVVGIYPFGISAEKLLSLAASVERLSEHPIGRAISAHAEEKNLPTASVAGFKTVAGSGVIADVEGAELCGGSFDFIKEKCEITEKAEALAAECADKGATPVYFTLDGVMLGIIAVADTVKADSAYAVAELRRMGLHTVMLTGDNERTANAVGKLVGVDEIISNVRPDAKAEAVMRYASRGKVIMVGDGINDAPSLTVADVGMAIGRGTDIAIESADAVLMHSRLSDVVSAVRLGRAVLKTVYENLFWAFIYNIIGIPLAAGAFTALIGWELSPMLGAAAMSISSITVVMNALRLNLKKIFTEAPTVEFGTQIQPKENIMKKTVHIKGMMCPHCEAHVREALSAIAAVEIAEVSHKTGAAVLTLNESLSNDTIFEAVKNAGYEVTSID